MENMPNIIHIGELTPTINFKTSVDEKHWFFDNNFNFSVVLLDNYLVVIQIFTDIVSNDINCCQVYIIFVLTFNCIKVTFLDTK